jgi:nucleotide-binding universal stress UspA family protein
MTEEALAPFHEAINDFHRAREQATLREILARIRGEPVGLLSFEEVRQKLKAQASSKRALKEIPLAAIVGSVNRYEDFTRDFLPRSPVEAERWARIQIAAKGPLGLPPIEVYQIGEVYFVLDGNHRVSVARQMGAVSIQAYVIEVQTRVPLTPDDQAEDVILKAEYAEFLEITHLDRDRPAADLRLTAPGQYRSLEEHIAVHRHFMGVEQQREILYPEAAQHWYDMVYSPIIHIIRERGMLRDFPDRTETDLYLWIAEHRAALEEEVGGVIDPERAADDLVAQFSPRAERVAARFGGKILEALTPDSLEGGPPPGEWRRERKSTGQAKHLFTDILAPVNGEANGWFALEQALVVAQREGAQLRGLHVVPTEAQRESAEAQAIQAEFERRCAEAGQTGKLVVATGKVARQICERARWNDLVVVNLAYPPAADPLTRLGSGFRELIQRCPRPVLATPQVVSPLSRALLAYDGSAKADEALYVAAYLGGCWQMPLVVVSILQEGRVTPDTQAQAQKYLESHGVQAIFVTETGPIAPTILKVAEAYGSDLIVMGGYSRLPLLNILIDEVVDQVLRESRKPMLLCR